MSTDPDDCETQQQQKKMESHIDFNYYIALSLAGSHLGPFFFGRRKTKKKK